MKGLISLVLIVSIPHHKKGTSKDIYEEMWEEDKQAEREDQVPESKPNCSVIKTKKRKKEMPGKPRERRLTHKYKQLMRSVVADFKTK